MGFSKDVTLTFGGKVTFTALGIASGIITARVLGPIGKGELQAVIIWPQLLTYICSMGIGWANVYLFAKGPDNRSTLFANSIFASICFGVLAVLVGEAIIPKLLGNYPEQATHFLRLFLLFIPLLLFSSLLTGMIQGCQNFFFYNLVKVLHQLLYVLSLTVLLVFGWLTVQRAIYSLMGIHIAVLIVQVWLVSRLFHLSLRPSFSVFKQSLNYGLKSHVGDVGAIVSQNLDQMFVIPILSSSNFGLYSVAVHMSRTIVLIPEAIMAVLIPEASRRAHKDSGKLTLHLLQGSFLALLILGAVLFAAAPYIIRLFFGVQFLDAVWSFRILLIGSVFLGLGTVVDGGLKGLGEPLAVSYSNWICIAVLVSALLILVPSYGMLGAALGYTLGFSSRLVVLLVLFGKDRNISMTEFLSLKDNPLVRRFNHIKEGVGARMERNSNG